jgi:hypothetical protein
VTPDERMDRLLRRTAQPPAGADACLDSETLAAFIDGGLAPAQRAAAEAHIADCGRCLELTSALVRSEPPPLATPRRSWFRTGWLVPLTTAAVAVTAWLVIRDPRPLQAPVLQEAPASAARERTAPLLPSETSKEAVPEFRQEQPPRADTRQQRRADSDATSGNRAVAERKAEVDAVAPGAPAAAASAAAPARPTADLARESPSARQLQAIPQMQAVPSPDPLVQWRFSEAALERTSDGGRTWMPHTPGATGFLAGAAPSADVLWLAGRAGLVLLTTDGRTWQRVDLPDTTADAVSITASDGRSARVTTAAGSTYRTSDAGRTWVLQENPAGSF